MGEIKPLTAMRGLFAMWVVIFHIAIWAPHAHKQLPIISRGYIAVDFFFILSGFILGSAHANQFIKYKFKEHLRFALKRFLRLFPLHWAVLAVLVAAMALQGTPLYWAGYIIDEALLIHRWGFSHSPRAVINGPDWSISTEWAANLLYPLFIWLIIGNRIKACVTVLTSTSVIYYIAVHNGWSLDFSFARSFIPLMRCFAEFAIGISIYRWRKYARVWSPDWVIGSLLVADGILVAIPSTDILVAATIPFLILGLSGSDGKIATLLASRLIHKVGEISYSIYLIQYPIMLFSLWLTPDTGNSYIEDLIFLILSIFLILIISFFTHKFIEVGVRQAFSQRTKTSGDSKNSAVITLT